MTKTIKAADSYTDKLLALIPTEVISLYLPGSLLISSDVVPETHRLVVSFIWLAAGLAATYVSYGKFHKVESLFQKFFVCLAFLIWAYTLKGPFVKLNIYYDYVTILLLPLFTFVLPWVYSASPNNSSKKK